MVHDEIVLDVAVALAQGVAHLLLEMMQDPGLQIRYIRGINPPRG